MQLALELDPFNPFVRGLYGAQLMLIGEFQHSVEVLEEVMQTTPGFAFGFNVLWQSYSELGRYDDAIKSVAAFYRHTQGDTETAELIEQAYQSADYATAMLQAARELEGAVNEQHLAPIFIGYMFEQAGNFEKAIDWYEIAVSQRDPDAPYVAAISKHPELHGNPRFIELLKHMKHYYWAGLYAAGPGL